MKIAGIGFRIISPAHLQLPQCFHPFMTTESQSAPDITIELFSGTDDIHPEGVQVSRNIFRTPQGVLQRYLWNNEQYFIRIEPADRSVSCRLGAPKEFFSSFCRGGNWLRLMAIERLLMPFNRVIIHASAVIWKNQAYIFVAPSGGGKSTQAELWEACGAEVLNGDKVILMQEDNVWYACGSPVAGSSGIYKNMSAPLATIFVIQKNAHNCAVLLSKRVGFLHLYANAIKSEWDQEFNMRLLNVLEDVAMQVPVYELNCTPDLQAVQCARSCIRG